MSALRKLTEFSTSLIMLVVYTYPRFRPNNTIDLSTIPLDEFAKTIQDIVDHQKDIELWFGYIDGWMLTPHEEVIVRKAIRKFECHVVSFFPLAFSQSWKNEIRFIYTDSSHGEPSAHNDGCSIHDGSAIGYGGFGS
jgi:hypothetical protein